MIQFKAKKGQAKNSNRSMSFGDSEQSANVDVSFQGGESDLVGSAEDGERSPTHPKERNSQVKKVKKMLLKQKT